MNVISSCCIIISIIYVSIGSGNSDGFDLFFKTNTDEMQDIPINFENKLPDWLKGTLIRNGLGQFEMGKRKLLHAFDGYSKLSSWKFPGNGSAFFSTKFLKTEFYTKSREKNDISPYLLFDTVSPSFDEIEKIEALTRGIDNMNVNVYSFFNNITMEFDYVATNDFWKVYAFQPDSLGTSGSVSAKIPHQKKGFTGKFDFLSFLSSAHPVPEVGTSNHFTYVSSISVIPGVPSTISLIRIMSLNKRETVAQWPVSKVSYMHSFAVTRQYVVFFGCPFYVNVKSMIETASPINSLDWHPEEKTNVYVINIKTGRVSTIQTESMFFMHFVNAFESDNGNIIVDISTYPDPGFVRSLEIRVLMDENKRNMFDAHAQLKRYEINVEKMSIDVRHIPISNRIPYAAKLDMPIINEKYRANHYCYVYGLVLKADDKLLSNIALVKKNVCGRPDRDRTHILEGHYPVEPWFIPVPGAVDEDDGLIMVPFIDGHNQTSYLGILDAKTMKLVNRADMPTIVPYSLHGRFFEEVS